MIYNLNGENINLPRNMSSELISRAYDVKGNVVFDSGSGPIVPEPDPLELVVMSYNPQWFSGINSQLAMLNEIFGTYNADIIGFQEYYKSSNMPSVAKNALANYPYKYKASLATNPNGIASKTEATSIQNIQYSYADDETWQYQKAKFTFEEKTITFYNTHLTWRKNDASAEGRRLQTIQLLADAQAEENVIITGDFNSYAKTIEDEDYINIFKPFIDAGYNMVNASLKSGFYGTYLGLTYLPSSAKSITEIGTPCDNIIVSGNIDLANIWYDETKLKYLNGKTIDHIPVVAKLIIH